MSASEKRRVPTGVDGLDEVLGGGLIENRNYVVRGQPGAGKTILALQFLDAGVEAGETCLLVNLEEDLADMRANARSLGFDVDAVEFLDLGPSSEAFTEEGPYDLFEAAEVEGRPVTESIVDRVREVDPDRVVVDPLTQLHYLTADDYQFRKQVVGFMRFLKEQGATAVCTTQDTAELPTEDLEFVTDGTVVLEATDAGRRIAVPKFRGSPVQSGDHAYRVTDRGIEVYPELVPGDRTVEFTGEAIPSGIPEVDELLGGGLVRGTTTVVSGPTGVGKTTLSTQFAKEAAGRGERSVIYLFEENADTFLARSKAINVPVEAMVERGTLRVEEVEALDQSPQEFARRVRREVETNDTSIVMVDGVAGYRLTLRGEESRVTQRLHALGRYLKNQGVTTILVDETDDVTGGFGATGAGLSYLADNIVFLRYLELRGELRKAIGVLKKRTGDFERTLRRYRITEHGIKVGEPLTGLRGILTGTPESIGEEVDDAGP